MRLIDADALNDSMYHEAFETDSDLQKWDSGCWFRYKMFENHLDMAPTVDAVPVVRGEWIEKTYIHEYSNEETEERQYVLCGICGKQPPFGFGAVNFCPNCGAKMEDKP